MIFGKRKNKFSSHTLLSLTKKFQVYNDYFYENLLRIIIKRIMRLLFKNL